MESFLYFFVISPYVNKQVTIILLKKRHGISFVEKLSEMKRRQENGFQMG